MKRVLLIALVIACAAILACQPVERQTGAMPLTEADIAAIKAIGPALDKAALASDWDAWIATYTEDGIDMPPNRPIVQGRSGLKALLSSYVGLAVTESEHRYDEINGYGDIAYAKGTYEETYTIEGAAEPIKDKGKVLSILRKQPDGTWKISINSWNSDLPLPE